MRAGKSINAELEKLVRFGYFSFDAFVYYGDVALHRITQYGIVNVYIDVFPPLEFNDVDRYL